MLGKKHNPMLKAKAAETKSLLGFATKLLQDNIGRVSDPDLELQGKLLLASCVEAEQFDSILRYNSRVMSEELQAHLLKTVSRFTTLYVRAGGVLLPKHHLLIHLVLDTNRNGNGTYYATYKDEEFNGLVAKIAKSCHKSTWHVSIFMKVHILGEIRA